MAKYIVQVLRAMASSVEVEVEADSEEDAWGTDPEVAKGLWDGEHLEIVDEFIEAVRPL